MGNSSKRRSPCIDGRILGGAWDLLGVFNHRDHSIAPAHRWVTTVSHSLDTFPRDSAPQLQLPFHQRAGTSGVQGMAMRGCEMWDVPLFHRRGGRRGIAKWIVWGFRWRH